MDEITKTEDTSTQRVSRRAAVKRIGTAGAIAWAAPVLATVNTPAFAQTGSPVACPDCDPICEQVQCGEDCGCVKDVDSGACFCHQGTPCDQVVACEATADCPPGYVCALSCCVGLRCLPPCGTFIQAAGVLGAEVGTSTGR